MLHTAIVGFLIAVFPALATADALAGKKKSELCREKRRGSWAKIPNTWPGPCT